MTAPNANYDAMLSTTLRNYRKTLEDNVFLDRPLYWWLTMKKKVDPEGGGESLVVPLMHAQNSTAASYSGYDPLDITAQEGITAAVFPWRQFAASIAISGIEEAKNAGEQKVLSLLEAKVFQAEETIKEKLNQMAFADGTGNSGKDFYGLANLISDTVAVGGINPADSGSEFWKSIVLTKSGSGAALVRANADWTHVYNSASKGNDHPDFCVTTQALFEHYEGTLTPNLRFTDTKAADAGFENLLFKTIPVMFDAYCPAKKTYFLNSKYIGVKGLAGRWLHQTPFKQVPDRDAKWANILTYGQMYVSNRSRHAVINAQEIA